MHHVTGVADFGVTQTIIDAGSLSPVLHNSFVPKNSQVTGNNCLGKLEQPCQVTYSCLPLPQLIDDNKPLGVSEGLT